MFVEGIVQFINTALRTWRNRSFRKQALRRSVSVRARYSTQNP
jgi:hypothetical protein